MAIARQTLIGMAVSRQTLVGMTVAGKALIGARASTRQILIRMAVAGEALIGMAARRAVIAGIDRTPAAARAPKARIDVADYVTDIGHSANYNMTQNHQLSPI
jgi:hypothetical protein